MALPCTTSHDLNKPNYSCTLFFISSSSSSSSSLSSLVLPCFSSCMCSSSHQWTTLLCFDFWNNNVSYPFSLSCFILFHPCCFSSFSCQHWPFWWYCFFLVFYTHPSFVITVFDLFDWCFVKKFWFCIVGCFCLNPSWPFTCSSLVFYGTLSGYRCSTNTSNRRRGCLVSDTDTCITFN